MAKINENYLLLPENYIFSEIEARIQKFKKENPDANIIDLGIGDVTRPLPKVVIEAFHRAVDEMGRPETFRGYGPEQGYKFLIEKIIKYDYEKRNIELSVDEVFISDGAKCDIANIQELFDVNNRVAVLDPVYPVYVETNVMAGRAGKPTDGKYENIVYLPCKEENNFIPPLPDEKVDLIYLCYPNNPTGTVLTKKN